MRNAILAIILVLPLAIAPAAWADGETLAPTSATTTTTGACTPAPPPSPPCLGNDAACAQMKKRELDQALEAHKRCMAQLARDAVSSVQLPVQ